MTRDEHDGIKPPNGCTGPQRTVLMVIDKMLDPVPLLPTPVEDMAPQMCYCLETVPEENGKTPLSMNQAIAVLNGLDLLNDMTTVKERGRFAEYLLAGVSNMSVDDALTTEKPRCLHRDTWYEVRFNHYPGYHVRRARA